MGSYSAPAFSLGYLKATHNVTQAMNAILIGPVRCVDFMVRTRASLTYDGDTSIDLQNEDGTWTPFLSTGLIQDRWQVRSPQAAGTGQHNGGFLYPYNVRVRVDAVPTSGSAVLNMITQPPPANPLF